MKPFNKVMLFFTLGLLMQGGVYYYLDRIYLVPASDFQVVGAAAESEKDGEFPPTQGLSGKAYYSEDKAYMAVVEKTAVKIYKAGKPNDVVNVDLRGMNVSFFEWLPDRNLAIMALYKEKGEVVLAQFNPEQPDHEVDTTIEDLPRGSKIIDVAYSTATNVVYMKVEVDENMHRIYRTDANYDTRRVHMQASKIGRMAVFYDEDEFFYDNAKTGDIYVFNGVDSSWRTINPVGRYRFIGLDSNKDIYIAKVNKDDEVLAVLRGRLGIGFKDEVEYDAPKALKEITVANAKEAIETRPAKKTEARKN